MRKIKRTDIESNKAKYKHSIQYIKIRLVIKIKLIAA